MPQLLVNYANLEAGKQLVALRKIFSANSLNAVQQILSLSSDKPVFNNSRTVGIDFSSPNIAKPFHVGHLRSSFIGRFLANFLQSSGNRVVRINYLGDWGTQFGLLAAGFDKFGTDYGTLSIKELYDVYVKANNEAKVDPDFETKGRHLFSLMESRDQQALEFWTKVRHCSIEYLKTFYENLNIQFDVWQSESQFAESARLIVEEKLSKNICQRDDAGLIGVKVLKAPRGSENNHGTEQFAFIPLARSDFTSLYLSRDVAAAIYRVDQMKLDHIYYVVDNEQHSHFTDLKTVLSHIGREDVAEKITHIKFGLIHEMSSREGKSIFVEDMVRQGEKVALETMKNASTTKVKEEDFARTAHVLAITAFLINDAKRKRTIGYSYDWKKILTPHGLGGYFLQAAHARLCSVEERCSERPLDFSEAEAEKLVSLLTENEAANLLSHLVDLFPKVLAETLENLDQSILVKYLLDLAHLSNAAHKKLRVVGSSDEIRDARLLLFSTSRILLASCLKLLGVEPLSKV